jgi:nitrate/TMAO reductase-like tetraheme cytochrome c subunit
MYWQAALLMIGCTSAICAAGSNAPYQRGDDAASNSAASCGSCHIDVHAEWQDSAHARAFVDPVFQAQLATRAEPEHCVPCHAPGPVLERLGQMPHARKDHREEGIHCIACHQSGTDIHGPNGSATSAHTTVKDAAFTRRGSFGLCRSCHDMKIADVLPLSREFEKAGLLEQDASCIGCHMETTYRAPAGIRVDPASQTRRGRSHRLLGPGDAEFCSSAFLLRVEWRGNQRVLIIANGAGHGVPGLARLRSFLLLATLVDRAGRKLADCSLTISSDDRLLATEERHLPLPMANSAVSVIVRVEHWFLGKKLATVIDQTLEIP